MPTRSQLTQARLEALIDILEAEGILTESESGELKSTSKFGEARGRSKQARKSRGKGPNK